MKKTTIKSAIILFSFLAFIACSNDNNEETQEVIFAGEWSGTFSGGDSGTWEIAVNNFGNVSGNVFSNNLQDFLIVEGTVDTSGEFRATAGSAENGATFTGSFTENSSSGTWENTAANISGTWQGTRN